MLNSGTVTANIPAGDLERAREFYADTLGLTPSFMVEGAMLVYTTSGGTTFSIYQTQCAGQAGHTIAQWHVEDLEAEVRDLKGKGIPSSSTTCPESSGTTASLLWQAWEGPPGSKTARETPFAWTTASPVRDRPAALPPDPR